MIKLVHKMNPISPTIHTYRSHQFLPLLSALLTYI
jgi:hypothetical protein